MIDLTKYYYFIFGVLTIVGGVMGYVKKGSQESIIAGGISGVLLLVAGALVATRVQPALILGLLVSLALGGHFGRVLATKGGFMPAGMMVLLSVIGIVLTAAALIARK